MEKFSLEKWLQDKSRKVIDDDGFPVEIIKWDANEKCPVVYLNHNGIAYNVSVDGMYDSDPNHGLFFADEEEELTELQKTLEEDCDCYVNLYNDGKTREELREWIKCWCHRIIELAKNVAYNPYKATVESIAEMVEKYEPYCKFDIDSNLPDFLNNVKIKCKDAMEYDKLFPQEEFVSKKQADDYELVKDCNEISNKIDYSSEIIGFLKNYIKAYECTAMNSWVKWLENKCGQSEQKSADEVKPKFEVGDWIINNDKRIAVPEQILKVEKYGYLHSRGYTSFDKVKTDYHLWTIQDANDGDVLVDNHPFIFEKVDTSGHCYAYCGINGYNEFVIESEGDSGEWTWQSVHPATNTETNLLFQKMKEAGYEWDAEKKELKGIEQKPTDKTKIYDSMDDLIADALIGEIEGSELDDRGKYNRIHWIKSHRQHGAWSEEDEKELKVIISELKKYVMLNQYGTPLSVCDISWLEELPSKFAIQPQPKQEWSEEDEFNLNSFLHKLEVCDLLSNKEITWLKNKLKSIKHWKPSEEQMQALFEAKLASINNREYFLGLLYEDLKKF